MRLENSMRNTFWSLIGQIILILTGLFIKTVLLKTVGLENIGLNHLFNDIVALLSIAELGVTGIIAYHLYEPLSKGNEIKIKQLMDLFKKIYLYIGVIVIVIGIGITPFLRYLVGTTTLPYFYITIVFFLFVLRSVEGYFFSYKQMILYADQKYYIIIIIDMITTVFYTILSIFVLLYTRNFIYVILIEIMKKITNDFIIIHIVNKQYPYITMKNVKPIEKAEIIRISKDVKDAFVSRASMLIVAATDNIVISVFLGISITGMFANYSIVLKTVENGLFQLIQSVQASVGNLMVEEKGKVIGSVLNKITFISFFMVSICGCCLLQLSTPFVALLFGKQYIMSETVVWICVFNIYLYIMQLGVIQFTSAKGLFEESKKIDLIGCIVNVILSIIGVKILGIAGVFLATFIARTIEFVFKIRLVFKKILNISYTRYIIENVIFFITFIIEVVAVNIIVKAIYIHNPIVDFLLSTMIVISIPLLVNIILYYSSEDFIYMMNIIKQFMYKKRFRKNKLE